MRFCLKVIFSAVVKDIENGKWNDYRLREMKGMECSLRGKLRFLATIFPHSSDASA